jgi:uncharacterized protein YggE
MPDDDSVEEAPGPRRADPRSGRPAGRILVGAVGLTALVLGGTGLGLALSDAGAATPVVKPSGCSATAPRLTVQGTGQASATPDVLSAVFNFSTTAGSSATAMSENNAEVNQALMALSANGVTAADVQTTGLTLQPQYVYPQGGVPTLTGYQVTNTVTATLMDVKTAGTAVDAVVAALGNAVQISGLTFSFADPSQVEDEARTDAVHLAVAHAGAMAAAAGRKLGPVCSLTDDTQPNLLEPDEDQNFDAAGTSKSAGVPVPLEPGTQMETDQVTMVYALTSR